MTAVPSEISAVTLPVILHADTSMESAPATRGQENAEPAHPRAPHCGRYITDGT